MKPGESLQSTYDHGASRLLWLVHILRLFAVVCFVSFAQEMERCGVMWKDTLMAQVSATCLFDPFAGFYNKTHLLAQGATVSRQSNRSASEA